MAARFSFRFNALMRLREIREQQGKRDFAEALQAVNDLRDQREENLNQRDDAKIVLRETQQASVNMNDVTNTRKYINALFFEDATLQQDLQTRLNTLEEKRTLLTKATQEKKIIEKLYERDKTAHQKEMDREEQKVLDDIRPSILNNEKGSAGQAIVMLGALHTLALFISIGMMFALGKLDTEKLGNISSYLSGKGKIINNDDYKVFKSSKENLKENEQMMDRAADASGRNMVSDAYEAQKSKLDAREKGITEMEMRLGELKLQLETEKKSIAEMQKKIKDRIDAFKKDRKEAEEWARSEGLKKTIRIFNNMEPASVATILEKDLDKPKELYKTTEYIRSMREELAAEVMTAMRPNARKMITEELAKPRRLYEN